MKLIVKKQREMVAEAEVVFQQSLPVVLDIDGVTSAVVSPLSSPKLGIRRLTASVSGGLSTSPVVSSKVSDMFKCCVFLFFVKRELGSEINRV